MVIFVDMDDVLTAFTEAAHKHLGVELAYDGAIYTPEFWNEIGENRAFWANMPWTEYGKELLGMLESYSKELVLCSSPGWMPGAAAGKIDWVNRELPNYREKLFLGMRKSMLAHPDAILIDDSEVNIDKFRNRGGLGILVPRPNNALRRIKDEVGHVRTQLLKHMRWIK